MEIHSFNPRLARRFRSLGITVMVLAALVLVQPFLWSLVHSTTIQLKDKRSQVQQIADLRSRVRAMEDGMEQQQASLDQLTMVAPLDRDTVQVLERLEGVAGQLGVAIDVVGIVEREKLAAGGQGNMAVFPLIISVTAAGQPSQLLGYVEAMEHLQELAQVKSFVIGAGDGGVFNLDMQVVFYLQRQGNGE